MVGVASIVAVASSVAAATVHVTSVHGTRTHA